MKQTFSPKWISSKQPRKQRKYRYNAPMHIRQKLVAAHLDKALRREYKRRSLPLRTGDEVVVVTGEHRKKRGKVTEVDLKKLKILVDGVVRKKVSGQEIQVPLDPSNVVITKLDMTDKKRLKVMRRKGVRVEEKKESKTEAKAEVKQKKQEKKEDRRGLSLDSKESLGSP
jgi:large subunit ribosomal protein L24